MAVIGKSLKLLQGRFELNQRSIANHAFLSFSKLGRGVTNADLRIWRVKVLEEKVYSFGERVLWKQPVNACLRLAQLRSRQSGLDESSRTLGIDELRLFLALLNPGFVFALASNPDPTSVRPIAVDFPGFIAESVLLEFDHLDRHLAVSILPAFSGNSTSEKGMSLGMSSADWLKCQCNS